MKRILFLSPGPYKLDEIGQSKLKYFSKYFYGDMFILSGHEGKVKYTSAGNFNIHYFLYSKLTVQKRNINFFIRSLILSVYLHYAKEKYDVIVSPNPLVVGLLAVVIAKLTGARSIIEVNGNFLYAFKYGKKGGKAGFSEKLKEKISKFMVPFVLNRTDGIKLLYKKQINDFCINNDNLITCFHDFVDLSRVNPNKRDKKYILFLGYPWLLKGVDVLIKSFNEISTDFPEYKLKIVGWCPEGKEHFENLAKSNHNIELCDPVYYGEAMELINCCTMLVLPSRTEAMGRVLTEARAARKPVIGSNVGGIPTYIKDGHNGLLFESENVEKLADKMRIILSDKDLAESLAENGYRYVHKNLSEECYISKYVDFIKKLTG